MSIKRRVENLENVNQSYLVIEDIIRLIELERKEHRTPEEQRQFEKLQAMEVEPKLHKTFLELQEKRVQRAGNLGPEIS